MKTAFFLLLAVTVVSLTCPSNQNYVKVIKYSGENANGETYTISKIVSGQATVIITGTVVAAQQEATNEHCLDTSDNGVYKLTLVQGSNQAWSGDSYITLVNVDDVKVFHGTRYSTANEFEFKVTPLVSNPTVSVKRTMEGTYDGWETLSFVEDSYWQSLNLATTRTEEFNHLTRYVFALPDLDKYSHVYIRMYYRYGISMFLNGVNIFNDHVAIVPELPPFFIPAEEGSGFSANTYVNFVVPASMFTTTGNLLAICYHYEEYASFQENWGYSITPVYASIAETKCSPVPITYRSSQGVKTGSEPASLVDRKISTATTFNAEIMNLAVDTDDLVLISEYALYRQGANAVKSWKVLNCGSTSATCSNWQDSASRVISSLVEGEYRYPCDSTTHSIGSIFRFTPLQQSGEPVDLTANEFSIYTCNYKYNDLMYLENEITAPTVQNVNIAPNPSHATGATWTTSPALPACLSIGAETGVITGQTSCLPKHSQYVILRTAGNITTRFYMTFTTNNEGGEPGPEEPTTAPTTTAPAPTEVPTAAPTETPVEDNSNSMTIIIIVVVVVVVIIIAVIALLCCGKKQKVEMKVVEKAKTTQV